VVAFNNSVDDQIELELSMFKMLFTVVVLLVILIAGSSYVSYLKKGAALLPEGSSLADNIKMPSMPTMPSFESLKSIKDDVDLPELLQQLKGGESESPPQDNSTVITVPSGPSYKWLENGSWHYGDSPPKNVTAIDLRKKET